MPYQILELESADIERGVKIKFRRVSQIYHSSKHQPDKTGVSDIKAKNHYQKATMHKNC